jgi:serine/threonine protein kinase
MTSLGAVPEEVLLPGKYKLDEEVCRSGSLRVVKAHEKDLDFFLKVVDPRTIDKQAADRFTRDEEFFLHCRDTRICPVVDMLTMGTTVFVVYNAPLGGNLEELMIHNGDTFSESFAKNVASSLLDALSFLHINEISHGCCLPRNVWFPMNPSIPGWLQYMQLADLYCDIGGNRLPSEDMKDLAYMLCALLKRNLAVFSREDFSPIVLKSVRWTHLAPDFVDFIEQLWIAEATGRDAEVGGSVE